MAAESSRIIHWALIGCGDIADRRVAPAISAHPRCELSLVMCRDTDRAGYFAEKHSAVWSTTRPETLFSDDEIDAVYIASPPESHAEYAIAAAGEGKHVLCEKPMALSAAECDAMVEAARKHGVRLGVAYYRRLFPQVQAMAALLSEGALGQPLVVRAAVGERYAPVPDAPGAWRLDPAISGGGPLQDIGSHRIDLLLHLFGLPERVGATLQSSSGEREVEEQATVLLRYASGMRGIIDADWSRDTRRDLFEITGTEGKVVCDPLSGETYIISRGGGGETRRVEFPENVHAPLIDDFARAILEDRAPVCSGEAGADVARVTELAYRSAAEKQFLTV